MNGLRYLSVCSGIEAATVAWEPLGWKPVAFAEIEKFPAAVLAYHYPNVPNLGDMTKINGADFKGKIAVLVGGTPCQSFSVAGLRRGLEDERGNLALEFVRLADECEPAFVVWENVPGILSDRGNAFGCFCAALSGEDAPLFPPGGKWTNAGYVLGPRRAIAWRILDAQYFGLAQRRKRVFLVACPRNGADPRKILFESEGLRRDSPPRRETPQDVAGTLESSLGRSRGAGTNPGAIFPALRNWGNKTGGHRPPGTDVDTVESLQVTQSLTGRLGSGGPDDNKAQAGFYVACYGGGTTTGSIKVSPALSAHGGASRRQDFDTEAFVVASTTPPLTGNQYGDHESREGLLVPMQSPGTVLAFYGSHVVATAMAFTERGRKEGRTLEAQPDLAYALTNPGSGGCTHSRQILDACSAVRRLTPRECERLQGFPDDYTAIPYRLPFGSLPKFILERSYQRYLRRMARQGKEPLQLDDLIQCADGPRYKALGNSMAVPVMRWIGERIARYA